MRLPASWRRVAREAERTAAGRARVQRRVRARLRGSATSAPPAVDPAESAAIAGLRHVNDETLPGIRRVGRPPRVRYVAPDGTPVRDTTVLQRIAGLVIPPAWTDVWICPSASGHIQATGRDARGRKQYRYHPRWNEVRDEVKYGRLVAFAQALPLIRRKTDADLRRRGLPREKVLAAVVQLLEKTLIRVGNDEYARQNGSIGLTTMKDRHARVGRDRVRFVFTGKSGVSHAVDLDDPRLARVVKACRDLPGQELFQYVDADGQQRSIGSADVNAYLRSITGRDFTAKDFRTWAGTVLAACALAERAGARSKTEANRHIVQAVTQVASRLGNTRTVCRRSYIHPAVLDAYLEGAVIAVGADAHGPRGTAALTPHEQAVIGLLQTRVGTGA